MTPTEQDKELEKQLVETILSILGITDRSSGNRSEQIATLEQVIEGYIIADRKRVALEARLNGKWEILSKIPDGTSVLENGKIGSAYELRIKVNREIAELKAQQEEV